MYQNTVAKARLDIGGALRTSDSLGGAIAHILLPPFAVDKKAGTIPSLLTTTGFILDIKHAPKTAYKRVEPTLGNATFNCEEAGIEVPMSAEDYDVVGQDEAEEIAANHGKSIVLGAREAALADVLTGATGETTFAGQVTNPVSGENWNEAGGLPIDDVAAADAALTLRFGAGPRWLVISQYELEALQTNAQIRSQYRNILGQTDAKASDRRLSLEAMASVLGVDRIIVSQARKNTGTVAAPVWAYVWPAKYALLVRGVENPSDLTEPVLGRMLMWDGANVGAEGELEEVDAVQALTVESYREESIKADIIRVSEYLQMKLLNVAAAQLIKLPAND